MASPLTDIAEIRSTFLSQGDNCTTNDEHPSKIVAFCAVILTAFVGLFGNVSILILFQFVRKLNSLPTRLLIQHLACQNILQSVVFDTLVVVFMSHNRSYRPSTSLCKFGQTVGALVFPSGYWCLFGLSLIRYCHCRGYSCYFKYRNRIVLALIRWSWLIGFVLGFPVNWDLIDVHYDQRLYSCMWNPEKNFLVQILVYIFFVSSPIFMTAYFNFILLCFPACVPLTKEQTNVIRSVITIYLLSLLFQFPFLLLMFFPNLTLPEAIDPWVILLACSRSIITALVFVWQSKTLRTALIMLLKCNSFSKINSSLAPRCQFRFVANKNRNGERASSVVDY